MLLPAGTGGAIIPLALAGGALGYVYGSSYGAAADTPSAPVVDAAPRLAPPLPRIAGVSSIRKQYRLPYSEQGGVVPRVVPQQEVAKHKRQRTVEPPAKQPSRGCGGFF